MDVMSYFNPPIPQKNHSAVAGGTKAPHSRATTLISMAAFGIGIGLALMSAFGADPTNEPQRLDFEHFHRPSILGFAERPFADAIADYPAAPFPLFYMLAGWIRWAAGSMLAVQQSSRIRTAL